MKYSIFATRAARSDILSAHLYISVSLCNPKAADDLTSQLNETAHSLSEFPKRNSLVNDAVLSSWGIRAVKVKNYTLFYVIDHKEQKIYVVRFLYSKRNWASILASAGKPVK